MVSETLTSEVATISTGVSKRSKIFEDAVEKSVGHEHAGGVNVDQRDFALAGDGFDHVAATHGLGDDARAGNIGAARIENQHRDVFLDGWNHGGGVQNLGAEVGQLGGFGEGDGLDAMAAGKNGRIGGEHAVDVGPDLDLFGVDAGAGNGCGEIGAAAAERGGDAVLGGSDEAAHDDYGVLG